MALKLRRGTNAGRTAITPAEGEPIFTTDTKQLYIGDGTTAGGVVIGGGGLTDGDKGDVTVSSSGATWTIDNGAVSYAKIQDVSNTSRLLGRATAGAGDIEEITIGSGLTLTGTTLSAGGGGGDVPTTMIVKSASESVTNSDTLQVDDELIFTGVVETHYYFEAVIFWHRSDITGSGDQPGIKIAFGNDVSTNGYFSTIPGNTTTTPTGASGIANVSLTPSMFRPYACKVSGSFYVTAGQNARLWFRWAQATPSATISTVVQKGSKLLVWNLT